MPGLRSLVRPLASRLWFLRPRYFPFQAKFRAAHPARLVEILALPRTGSTLAKRYLGDYPGLDVSEYGGFYSALARASERAADVIVLDKRTKNIHTLDLVYRELGNRAWYLAVVRDPRDQIASLFTSPHLHPEIPRDLSFWTMWGARYDEVLDLAARRVAHGGRFALVRYEDLVTDPVAVKTAFVAWLGIPGRAPITDEYGTQVERLATARSEDQAVHRQRSVSSSSLGKWRELTGDARALCAASGQVPAAARLMTRLGYGETLGPCPDLPGVTRLG